MHSVLGVVQRIFHPGLVRILSSCEVLGERIAGGRARALAQGSLGMQSVLTVMGFAQRKELQEALQGVL